MEMVLFLFRTLSIIWFRGFPKMHFNIDGFFFFSYDFSVFLIARTMMRKVSGQEEECSGLYPDEKKRALR
jgi:hypothetical protein